MTPAEYRDFVKETAIYNPNKFAIEYPALGLVGEVGELANKIKKGLRDGDLDPTVIRGELGDCLWYCFALAADCGGYPADFVPECWHSGRLIPSQAAPHQIVLLLASVVGNIADETYFRDDDPPGANHKIVSRLYDALIQMDRLAAHYDTTLMSIADANAAKLRSRRERGVLQGSGDNR